MMYLRQYLLVNYKVALLYGDSLRELSSLFPDSMEFAGKKVTVIDHNDIDLLGTFDTEDGDTVAITNIPLTAAVMRPDLEFSDHVRIYSIQVENGAVIIRCSKDSYKT